MGACIWRELPSGLWLLALYELDSGQGSMDGDTASEVQSFALWVKGNLLSWIPWPFCLFHRFEPLSRSILRLQWRARLLWPLPSLEFTMGQGKDRFKQITLHIIIVVINVVKNCGDKQFLSLKSPVSSDCQPPATRCKRLFSALVFLGHQQHYPGSLSDFLASASRLPVRPPFRFPLLGASSSPSSKC